MKRCLHIVSFLVGLAMLVACSQPTKVEVPEFVEGATKELATIDSLMWHHPDSALAVMMEFAASPEADSMDVFEGHYCQVLVAELLFKNDYGQSNREEVLKAVHFFLIRLWGWMGRTHAVCPHKRMRFWRRGHII